jgi:hypothetical protein
MACKVGLVIQEEVQAVLLVKVKSFGPFVLAKPYGKIRPLPALPNYFCN